MTLSSARPLCAATPSISLRLSSAVRSALALYLTALFAALASDLRTTILLLWRRMLT
jgi:hypothetical protein